MIAANPTPKRYSPLIGSLVYTFSGFVILSAVRHPFFINPMIQLPLLLIGIDCVIKKRQSKIFAFAVFYSALCGFISSRNKNSKKI